MGKYVDASTVIRYLGEDQTDPVLVADVEFTTAVAEELVDQYCRCNMAPVTGEKIYSGTGTRILVLREFIRAIDSVEVIDEDGEVSDALFCVVMPDNPRWGAGRWIERKDGLPFPEGKKNLLVTGDFGFDPIPKQLEFCVALTIKSMFQRRQIDEFILSESGNGRLLELKEDKDMNKYIPVTARAILDQFRNSASLS